MHSPLILVGNVAVEFVIENLGPVARKMVPYLLKAEEEMVVELRDPLWGIPLNTRDIFAEYMEEKVTLPQLLENLEIHINAQLAKYSDRVKEIQQALRAAGLID